MDGNGGMNYRNWSFYEPPSANRGHLGLQLMSGGQEKPILGGRSHPAMINNHFMGPFHHMPMTGGPYHHPRVGGLYESPNALDVNGIRESWMHSREKYFTGLPSSHHHYQQQQYSLLSENSSGHEMQMMQPNDSPNEEEGLIDEIDTDRDISGSAKKRQGGKIEKSPKAKKSKKAARAPRDDGSGSVQRARAPKKSLELVINGVDMDISSIPIPICSCTGASQQCYKWGSGGWQSACCTTGMSVYPLPMSTKRRGARIAGRKMSIGAFKKVLEKLASEGYDFSHPIDLRTHWAKHGTNKFVTIR